MTVPRADNPQPFTLTVRWRAKWWKRPWLWIRRKPTSRQSTYHDLIVSRYDIQPDGGVVAHFQNYDPGKLPTIEGSMTATLSEAFK